VSVVTTNWRPGDLDSSYSSYISGKTSCSTAQHRAVQSNTVSTDAHCTRARYTARKVNVLCIFKLVMHRLARQGGKEGRKEEGKRD
jgi:hypothetical protein